MLSLFWEAAVLAAALSADIFLCAVSFGAGKITVPFSSKLLVSALSGGMLFVSLLASRGAGALLPEEVGRWLSFAVLMALGAEKLFLSKIRAFLKARFHGRRAAPPDVLQVYASPVCADKDGSSSISPGEAVALAFAVSFDSVGAGLGAGMLAGSLWLPAVMTGLTSYVLLCLGLWAGRHASGKIPFSPDLVSGLFFVLFAVAKLL